jgi:dTDP-4-amino-4,6-dideoxygalactose transaminase
VGPADRTGHGCQSLPVLIDEARYGLARDDLYRLLWHENVLARRYFHPGCHRLTPYRDAARGSMAVTERVADTILCLPAGPHVTTGDVATIVGLLAAARASRDEVRAWLASGQSADAARAANQAAHE